MPANPHISDRFDGLLLRGQPLYTSEVRWFASGSPPANVVAWFSDRGRSALVELRRDAYRVSLDHSSSVKRRDRGPLELKRRHGITPRLEFGPGLAGRVEEWRKHQVEEPLGTIDWQWSAVDKVVLTRTFALDGAGSAVEVGTRDSSAPACDIELATVTAGDLVAWSFAMEACGDGPERSALLSRSLDALLHRLPPAPAEFVDAIEVDMGYPEWLAETIWRDELASR